MKLVLASESPRRRELLSRLGIYFETAPPSVDERVLPGEAPEAYVGRVALGKARAVAASQQGACVLAADTAVILGADILGKPGSSAEAERMLERLAGNSHLVLTAVAVIAEREELRVVSTQVNFRSLSPAEIRWYAGLEEPLDKAGAYAIQGIGAALVRSIDGSPTNVIGLPLPETLELLSRAGLSLPWSPAP